MILLGTPRGAFDADMTEVLRRIHLADMNLSIHGAHEVVNPTWENPFLKHSRERSFGILLRLLAENRLIVEPLISRVAKPEEACDVYERLRNGPMIFIRALNDANCTRSITPQQIAECWLNYAPYEHGFYWWGGYGRSTEHTAYLNLLSGIPAPRSGSVEQNGSAIAEQIGGQIFIDTWGLAFPNQPELAAEFAGKAASVSHGGNGVYGGQYVAAAISLAFTAKSVKDIVLGALEYIPRDCEYARAVRP